jgi:cation diffusion facilitator CzcD-associated flavoprotein CzcO
LFKLKHICYKRSFSGVGGLRIPHIPKEYTSFEGKLLHSAEWDNSYDYNGKRVAIIGNGARYASFVMMTCTLY